MKILLAILAYIIAFAILALTGITIEALGAWLFAWQTRGAVFTPFAITGAMAGVLAFLAVMGTKTR
ncbi:hypothetical protein [Rothia nasimurium]|uniref:hypothetical protein n=1 Tax=Rothia nasimurium TaxID=85336 RepID=UPI001F1EA8CF|nr:hypothetical protein [Rothia nasimurium]